MTCNRTAPGSRSPAWVCLAAILLIGLSASAWSQPLELSFCAQVAAWPMSQRDRPGFDNAIAEILADELGAVATFTWVTFDNVGVRDSLHAGLCDIAIGVGESVAGMLNTVPYLSTPYVFVTRTDRGIDIASLDDPRLAELRIGTYQAGIPSISLRNRGIVDNVREYPAVITPTGADNHNPILDAVLAGDVDVGIVYGPVAGQRALEEDGVLTIEPVTPEIDFGASILQLSRTWTIGVRPFDESLRDRLNRALAARWDDVNAVLDAYGVPRWPVSRPVVTEERPDLMRLGVIYPARTPASLPNAAEGESARMGTQVAENAIALADPAAVPLMVFKSNAPTIEAVERAALRLITVERVDALVGGFNDEEAHLLARIAAEHGVVFFNVGAEGPSLRNPMCYPSTLHVAPSANTLARASLEALARPGSSRLFLVQEEGVEEDTLAATVRTAAAAHGLAVVGEAMIQPEQFIFFPLMDAIADEQADTVLLLANPELQERFLSQTMALSPQVRLIGLSTVRGQSRAYLQRYLQVAPVFAAEPRVVVWDPALDADLNDRFTARTAEPMEAPAWTTHAAILSAYAAARAGVVHDADGLIDFLTEATRSLDLDKLTPVHYRAADHQLVQELYVVEAVPGASWGRTASARSALAQVSGVLEADATLDLPMTQEPDCIRP